MEVDRSRVVWKEQVKELADVASYMDRLREQRTEAFCVLGPIWGPRRVRPPVKGA